MVTIIITFVMLWLRIWLAYKFCERKEKNIKKLQTNKITTQTRTPHIAMCECECACVARCMFVDLFLFIRSYVYVRVCASHFCASALHFYCCLHDATTNVSKWAGSTLVLLLFFKQLQHICICGLLSFVFLYTFFLLVCVVWDVPAFCVEHTNLFNLE